MRGSKKKTAADPVGAKPPRCTVRMYCHGLGDCFLVTNHSQEGPFRVMIDAGVLLGTSEAKDRMKQVFKSIADDTGGKIDLLVVTHQHWDHVSGFIQAQTEFEKLDVKRVWYAWTEDPNDPVGVQLQTTRKLAATAVENAVQRMGPEKPLGVGITEMLDAFGVSAKSSGTTADAMKLPGRLFPAEYRQPGETLAMAGVRFHILGPPRDKLIFRSDPSKKESEVYVSGGKSHAFGLGQSMGMIEAVNGLLSQAENDLTRPFDSRHCHDLSKVSDFYPYYQHEDHAWRSIEEEWQNVVGQLSLQLDSDTNNTSLAFAIEIPETGKVLLFAADAQVGNWLSWHDQQWKFKDGEAEKVLTATDLLNRTVFYKVGHHGSHNATLRAKGLEMMLSKDLFAMIPVEVEMARKKKWLEMPLDTLLARLQEKAKGCAVADDPGTFGNHFRPSEAMNRFTDPPRPLWVELDIT